MGSFVFKWPHPDAKDVHVTGTFDDWGKSEALHKVGDFWEKEVNLPSADEKVYYKFVVDDNWVIDPTAPQEDDGHYNINNVLLPKDIKRHAETSAPAAATTATAAATPAAAAPTTDSIAEENKTAPPGAFPETPAQDQEQSFGVAPIPATSGIGNPIDLPAGEKVPDHSTLTDHTVESTATTSKEGYERDASAALPAVAGLVGAGGLAAAVSSVFSKPESKENVIPESSLPMGGDAKDTLDSGPHIQSAAPESSTAALAAGVPLEKKRQAMVIDPADAPQTDVETAAGVPETVKESIAEAHQAPEAAASAEAVEEKSAVEQELLQKTTVSEATGDAGVTAANQDSYYGLATDVPATVEKSMQEAHAPPEAAADSSVVAEKTAVEEELLKKVPSSEAAGEPAPTIAAATSESAPSATKDAEPPSSGLSTGEEAAVGAVGGMGVAGVVAALASGKQQESEAPKAEPASGEAPFGTEEAPAPATESLSKGETEPVGTVTEEQSTSKPETVEHVKDDPTQAETSTSGKASGIVTGAVAAAGAAAAGVAGTLGLKSSAPAAVADGTDSTEAPTAAKSSVPLEKTEGDAAEYAPVSAIKTEPGVAPAAVAAVADGAEDPTLADEPAVKMMQQEERKGDIGTGSASAHEATTTTTSIAKEAATPVAATSSDAAGKAAAPASSASEKVEKTLAAAVASKPTTSSATSTPVKKIAAADSSTSSPAESANTKEKKKRNRLSRLYHKIVD